MIKRLNISVVLIFMALLFPACSDSDLMRLAKQGDAEAQKKLGVMYDLGEGVPDDDKAAVKWYTLAAEQGSAKAQRKLGVMYDHGEGVPEDDKAAVKWYALAAEQGLAQAQYNLGVMYRSGAGVILDNVYAHMWFNIAGSNGVESAAAARDAVANRLTKADLTRAQDLARNCVRKEYKGC